MEFLSIFGLVFGVFIFAVLTVAAITLPFYSIFDWVERKYGFGVGFGAGLLWMVFSGSLIISLGYYVLGLR